MKCVSKLDSLILMSSVFKLDFQTELININELDLNFETRIILANGFGAVLQM
jgi:hypothetical protein